jgi:hypothetical protein
MAETRSQNDDVIQFLRTHDYKLVKELGQGACGKTVLLYDDQIDQYIVCKKYVPFSETHRKELFTAFVQEVKLLHRVHHRNVVRVFNHYLYPTQLAGFILMEYVDGTTVDKHISQYRDNVNEVFQQAISGFSYLEQAGILHRDIRPQNIMVCVDGTVKIIDLGFGKKIEHSQDFAKSISLNWWCDPPAEFEDSRYDFGTEVYFVGTLFRRLLDSNKIDNFKYSGVLAKMCQRNPAERTGSFTDVDREIGSNRFDEVGFNDRERRVYQEFADAVIPHLTKIERGAKYVDDPAKVSEKLGVLYRSFMLENIVPDCAGVLQCLVTGAFNYRIKGLPVACVKDFARMLATCGDEKGRIILANLYNRLNSVPRYNYEPPKISLDDIPF